MLIIVGSQAHSQAGTRSGGTTTGFWAVRHAAEIYKFALLSCTAGIRTTVTDEKMISEAHTGEKGEEIGLQTMGLTLGFGLFILLSAYLD